MTKLATLLLLLLLLLGTQEQSHAQTGKLDSLFANKDTTAVMDSLMKDFDAFLDSLSKPTSFVSVSAGIGNRSFSIKNNSLNSQEARTNQLSFTPTLSYFHKSGFSLSATGFAASPAGKFIFYQYAVTPSYDYIGEKWAAGLSYTRYFGKDTATIEASPYDNDWYAYLYHRNKHWRYGITAGYATGRFDDKLSYSDSIYKYSNILQRYVWIHYTKTIASENHIKDLSVSASLRRDFGWDNVLLKDDHITASVTGYVVAGSTRINSNNSSSLSLLARKISLSKFKKSYASADGNGFQFQSIALGTSIYYTIGHFNIQPLWFMDYYLQDAETKFSQVFSLSFAWNF